MSTRKTKVEESYILKFLQDNFDSSITSLSPLSGGEMSQAFAFDGKEGHCVIKIDSFTYSYLKDEYAWKHFASDKLPIPKVIKVGKLDDKLYFLISERLEGKTLDLLTKNEIISIMPSIISTLDQIHRIDVSNSLGYGYWDPSGVAKYGSWREYLISLNSGIDEWKSRYKTDFLDPDIFERIYAEMMKYVDYCPEEKYLLHGDYGFTNLIVEGEKIAGVLDWGESRYGDFVFDIAWLDMWQDEIKYQDFFLKFYTENKKEIPNYKERILCYHLNNSYGTFKFFVESGQIDRAIAFQGKVKKLF